MIICLIIGILIIVLFLMLLITVNLMDIVINRFELNCIMLTLTFLLFLFGFLYIPFDGSSIDIVRHFSAIEDMRSHDLIWVLDNGLYKELPVANIFMYLVSRTKFNSLWVAIPTAINCFILWYIVYDNYRNETLIKLKDIVFIVFCFLALFSLKYMFCAVRTNLAIAIASLAFYKDYIKKGHKILPIALYFIASQIHYFSAIVIFIRLLLLIIKKRSYIWLLLLFIFPILKNITDLIFPTPFNYINNIFRAVIYYDEWFNIISVMRRFDDGAAFLMLFGSILISIFIFFNGIKYIRKPSLMLPKKISSEYYQTIDCRIQTNIFLSGILSISMFFNYLVLERFLMFMAFSLLFYLPYQIKTVNKKWKLALFFICGYLLLWDIFSIACNITGYNPLDGIGEIIANLF